MGFDPTIFAILAAFAGGIFLLGGDSSDDSDDGQEQDDQSSEETPETIFDDTLDDDNGVIQGTDADETLIGNVEAGGEDGAEEDTTTPDDEINAGGGDDTVLAGNGDDTVFGEDGDDTLDGGTGDDALDGGDGEDMLIGGEGMNTLTGGEGDDVFEVLFDDDTDTITDFSNEDGNRDFIDLSEDFVSVADVRGSYDPMTGTLTNGDGDTVVFSNLPDADVFTEETTGLPLNIDPEANDDVREILLAANAAGGIAVTVVNGTQVGTEADTDVDGETSDLQIASINGVAVSPGDTVPVGGAQNLFIQPNGQTAVVNVDTALDFGNVGGQVTFTYTVVDAFGGESDPATVTLNVTIIGAPV